MSPFKTENPVFVFGCYVNCELFIEMRYINICIVINRNWPYAIIGFAYCLRVKAASLYSLKHPCFQWYDTTVKILCVEVQGCFFS